MPCHSLRGYGRVGWFRRWRHDRRQAPDGRRVDTEDLKEFFEERACILEYDAGIPRPEAEIEAARFTATYAPNSGYVAS
jgi:hypothetical protein